MDLYKGSTLLKKLNQLKLKRKALSIRLQVCSRKRRQEKISLQKRLRTAWRHEHQFRRQYGWLVHKQLLDKSERRERTQDAGGQGRPLSVPAEEPKPVNLSYKESTKAVLGQPHISTNSSKGDDSRVQLPNITEEILFKDILPHLTDTSALITHYKGRRILERVQYNATHTELLKKQNIIILHEDEFQEFDKTMYQLMLSQLLDAKKTLGYIVRVDNHYVSFIVTVRTVNCIYFTDSKQNSTGIKQYPDLISALGKAFSGFPIIDVKCPQQSDEHSLANAYLNARVLAWGLIKYGMDTEAFEGFLKDVLVDDILSTENANFLRLNQKVDLDQKKTAIEQIIDQGVEDEATFSDIVNHLTSKGLNLDERERLSVQNSYIECVQNRFLEELNENTANLILIIDTQNLKCLDDIRCKPFTDLKSHGLFERCTHIMNESQKHKCWRYIWDFLQHINIALREQIEQETAFIAELLRCIKYYFVHNQFNFKLFSRLTINNNSFDCSKLLSSISETTLDMPGFTTQLSNMASRLHDINVYSETFQANFEIILQALNRPPTVYASGESDKIKLFFQNCFVNLQEALWQILQQHTIQSVQELHVSATELLVIDQDLTVSQWHGKNIIVTAKNIVVVRDSCIWDVSGKCTDKNYDIDKAVNGQEPGDDGMAAEHGLHGESGGNVLLVCDNIENSNYLKIISNGANGGNGQHGGDGGPGRDGEDGFGLSEDNFKIKFPDPAVVLIHVSEKNKTIWRQHVSKELEPPFEKFRRAYYRMETKEGNEVIYAYNRQIFFQSYCLHFGTSGTNGTKGGDGGRGGMRGKGGYSGNIDIYQTDGSQLESHNIQIVSKDGNDGIDGKYGKGARGGMNGKKAPDRGRVTEYAIRKTHFYNGFLRLIYRESYLRDGVSAWCPKYKQYASVQNIEPPIRPKQAESGADGGNKRSASGTTQEQLRRQVPVLVRDVLVRFRNEIQQNSFNRALNFGILNNLGVLNPLESKLMYRAHYGKLVMPKSADFSYDRLSITIPSSRDIPSLSNPEPKTWQQSQLKFKSSRLAAKALQQVVFLCEPSIQKWIVLLETLINVFEMTEFHDSRSFPGILHQASQLSLSDLLRELEKRLQTSQLDKITITRLYDLIIAMKNMIHEYGGNKPKLYSTLNKNKTEERLQKLLNRSRYILLQKYKFIKMTIYRENAITASLNLVGSNTLPTYVNLPDLEKCIRNRTELNLIHFMQVLQNINDKQSVNDLMDKMQNDVSRDCDVETIIQFIDPGFDMSCDYFRYIHLSNDSEVGRFVTIEDNAHRPGMESRSRPIVLGSNDSDISSLHFYDDHFSLDTDTLSTDDACSARNVDIHSLSTRESEIKVSSCFARDQAISSTGTINSTIESTRYEDIPNKSNENSDFENLTSSVYKSRLSAGAGTMTSFESCILSLSFVKADGIDTLKKLLQDRYVYEGIHIPNEISAWLITFIIRNEELIPKFIEIFAFCGQSNWLKECILLQIKLIVPNVSIEDEDLMRKKLADVESQTWLLFLSQRLNSPNENKSSYSVTTIEEILTAVRIGELDHSTASDLTNLQLSSWPAKLRLRREFEVIEKLPVEITSDDLRFEFAYYIWELRNINGDLFIDNLETSLCVHDKIDEIIMIMVLKNLLRNRWSCNEGTLVILKSNSSLKWEQLLDNRSDLTRDRDTKDLFQIMIHDSNNSVPECMWGKVGDLLTDISRKGTSYSDIIDIANKRASPQQSDKKYNRQTSINSFEEKGIRTWCVCLHSERKKNNGLIKEQHTPEILAVVFRSIDLHLRRTFQTNVKMRDTQKIAVVLFLLSKERGTLEQVATGEGKSLIIVALAIFKLLNGSTVDIITSSSVLAKRDAKMYLDLYGLFDPNFASTADISMKQIPVVSHNCSEDVEDRKRSYMSPIVYGEIGTFQRDILLDEFYDENVMGDRGSRNVIVDEVDSMLLDKGQSSLYLTNNVAGLDYLEQLYVHIWNAVHAKGVYGTEQDEEEVFLCMMASMFAVVRRYDITRECTKLELSSNQLEQIWRSLIDEKVIDEHGRVLLNIEEINCCQSIRCPLDISTDSYVIGCIKSALKDTVRKGTEFTVPRFLESFVERHLRTWIKHAFEARFRSQYESYIIDIDRSTNYQEYSKVIIMDTDTGSEQYNSQWNKGLHQFLQMKHACRVSPESLKAVFISNILFFKRYEANIYGLTGTLGSEGERSLLKRLYDVEYVTVPTFRPSRFVEEDGVVCSTRDEWLDKIKTCIEDVIISRPVLVICETIRDINTIVKYLKNNSRVQPTFVYDHSYQEAEMLNDEEKVTKGCLILATNLAGRGTDIKISEETNRADGLFVCLTYMPRNIRVQQQAFGRTARKGQNGSGQMIILQLRQDGNDAWTAEGDNHKASKSTIARFIDLMTDRNMLEQRRINEIQIEYDNKISAEEKTFRAFRESYVHLRKILQEKGKTHDETQLILKSILDDWAFWLDSVEEHLKHGEDISKKLKQFLTVFAKVQTDIRRSNPTYEFIDNFVNNHKLGKLCIAKEKYDMAIRIFDEVIQQEPDFSEIAHYYKAHCLVKLGRLSKDNMKNEILRHMQHAKKLLETRIETLHNSTSIIDTLYEQSLVFENSCIVESEYKQQKDGIISIYQTFLDSVDDICGHEITPLMVQHIVGDPIQANMIIEDLIKNKTLVGYKRAPHYAENLKELEDEYQLHMPKIKEVVANLPADEEINEDNFRDVLPSREGFWTCLLKAQILIQEEEYMIVNMKKIKETQFIIFSERLNDFLEQYVDFDSDERFIWMYPEHVVNMEDKKIIKFDYFTTHFGHSTAWKFLQEQQLIVYNKRALFRRDINLQSITLESYDNIDETCFALMHGIDDNTSRMIFKVLQDKRILTKGTSIRTKLMVFKSVDFDLGEYQHFVPEITSVISMSFRYRLELVRLVRSRSFTLSPKPNKDLFNELIRNNVILPLMVADRLGEDALATRIDDLYGKENTFTKEIALKTTKNRLVRVVAPGITEVGRDFATREFYETKPLLTGQDIEYICRLHDVPECGQDGTVERLKAIGWIENDYVALLSRQTVRNVFVKVGMLSNESPRYRITIKDKDASKTHIFSTFTGFDFQLQQLVLGKFVTHNYTSQLSKSLFSWKSGLSKYSSIDSHLVDLDGSLDNDTKRSMAAELAIFSLNGLDHVMSLSEERWSRVCILTIAVIVAFAVLQIAAGALVEILTVGVATPVGLGLIGEGVGDLLFAFECAIRGYCTPKQYAKHKAISLAFTVAFGGLGAWWCARSSRYAKYGVKVGRKAAAEVTEVAGTEAVEQIGAAVGTSIFGVKKQSVQEIVKRVACKVGIRVAEATAEKAVNHGLDSAIKNLVHHHMKVKCNSAIDKAFDSIENQIEEYRLGELLEQLYSVVTITEAKVVAEQITSHVIENDTLFDFGTQKVDTLINLITSAFSSGIGKVGKKICGNYVVPAKMLSIVATSLVETLTNLKVVDSVTDIVVKWIDNTCKQVQDELKAKVSITQDQSDEGPTRQREFARTSLERWKTLIKTKITSYLENRFVHMSANDMSSVASRYVYQRIRRELKSTSKHFQNKQEFEELKAIYKKRKHVKQQDCKMSTANATNSSIISVAWEEYTKSVQILLKKTKNPLLLAHMIKAGIPLDIHCTQAIAEILRRPIQLQIFGKDTYRQKCTPRVVKKEYTNNPLLLNYYKEDKSRGYFSLPLNPKQETDYETQRETRRQQFDCLLHALCESGANVERMSMVQQIHNTQLQQFIRDSFDMFDKATKVSDTSSSLRLCLDSYGSTDSHTICGKMLATLLWGDDMTGIDESVFGLDGDTYDHTRIFKFFRLDYRWIPFTRSEDGVKLGGHKITELQKEYFDIPSDENKKTWRLRRDRTAQEATVLALIKHVELTKTNDDCIPPTVSFSQQIGYHGNTAIPRHKYIRGLKRERYKILQIAKRLMENAPKDLERRTNSRIETLEREFTGCLVEDPFPKLINDRLKTVKTLQDLGDILKSPAKCELDLLDGELENTSLKLSHGIKRAKKVVKRQVARQVKKTGLAISSGVSNLFLD